MAYTIDLLSIQTPAHLREGLEYRTRFDCGVFEVNVFETFQPSTKVQITYEGLSISSMVRGSKVVYTAKGEQVQFMPGTSLILADGETVYADFPDAGLKNPVQCATVLIPRDTVESYLMFLNKHYPDHDGVWELDFSNFHFNNNPGLVRTLNELLNLATQEKVDHALSDLMLKALLVRVVHAQREHTREQHTLAMDNRLLLVKKFIKEHLDQALDAETLAEVGNCSRSSLHRLFETYCNKTPGAYVLHARMTKAHNLLLQPNTTISAVAHQTGYNSVSYFVKQFKSFHNCTPGDFVRKFGKQ